MDRREELARLRAELEDRRRRLPAHSIRPHQLLEIEELEERIARLERELVGPCGSGGSGS
ncbi:hypothetical protein [Deferrisoma camini]|uniref:hypothetical protein n=1 Tax=Deferrisoma camini TaxID=1035120 RepID=UPI00046CBC18|nr:hypothetical protein [Deferrisoma camini]